MGLTAGARYTLKDTGYRSAAASYPRIDGVDDQRGLPCDDFELYVVDLGIGYSF